MNWLRTWLRGWLGVDTDQKSLDIYLNQRWNDIGGLLSLEKEMRDAAIRKAFLESNGPIPPMNQRIVALEQTAVNGLGVEAIVEGRLEPMKAGIVASLEGVDRNFTGMRSEIDAMVAALDAITALDIQKRLIELETKNVTPVEVPRTPDPAGSWSNTQHRIDRVVARATNGLP